MEFYYIRTKKSMKHASADVGLIFTAFNLRRIFKLIDKNMVKEYLEALFGLLPLTGTRFELPCGLAFYLDMLSNLNIPLSIVPSNRLYLD